MSEKPVSPVTGEPLKVENYYFQIVLGKLVSKAAVAEPFSNLRFSIFKGKQKFESTKNIPGIFVENALALVNHRLNFVVLNYNPAKVQEFTLKVSHLFEQSEKELGEYIIDCNSYIDHFRTTENGAFVNQWDLGELFYLDIEIYIERSRYGVEKLHKEVKNPKPKRADEQPVVIPLQKITPRRRERTNPDSSLQKSIEKENRYKRVSPKKDAKLEISKRLESSKPAKDILIEQPPAAKRRQSSEARRIPETPKKIEQAKQTQVQKVQAVETVKPAELVVQNPVNSTSEPEKKEEINTPKEIEQKAQIKQVCEAKPQPQITEIVQAKQQKQSSDKLAEQKKNSEQFYTPQEVSVNGSKNQGNTVKDEVIKIKKESVVEQIKKGSVKNSKVLEAQEPPAPLPASASVTEEGKPAEVPEQKKPEAQVSESKPLFKLQYPSFMKDCPLNIKFIAPIFILLLIGFVFVIFTVFGSSSVEPILIEDPALVDQNQTILPKSKKNAKIQKKAIKTKQTVEPIPPPAPPTTSKGAKSKSEAPLKSQAISQKSEAKSKKITKETKSTSQPPKKSVQKKKQSAPSKPLKPTLKATKMIEATPTQTATYIPTVIPPSGNKAKEASSKPTKSSKITPTEPQASKPIKVETAKVPAKFKQPKKAKIVPTPTIKPVNTKLNVSNPPVVQNVSKPSADTTTASNSSNSSTNASKLQPGPAPTPKKGKKSKVSSK